MDTHPFDDNASADQGNSRDESSLPLRSGTGAPIFESGPTTRIRRNPVRAIASATWDGGPPKVFGQILDVSLTGSLFRTESTIPEGTQLNLEITLIGCGEPTSFDVRALVQRTTTVRDRKAYGIAFITESGDEKQSVQALYSATAR